MAPPKDLAPGRVSIIVLNWNGGDETPQCLEAVAGLADPGGGFEVIVVDNGSTDGSREEIARRFPDATLVANARNLGFAGGCNKGVEVATGEFLAFLNNDARPERDWLVEAVGAFRRRADVACVASKVISLDGTRSDFVGDAGVTFYGFGYRDRFNVPLDDGPDEEREVLFGTGSALVVRADVYRDVGGFDDKFFAFFEDVDLGWRLWLLGHRVLYIPTSVVRHAHHGTMGKQAQWREDYLLERNAMFAMLKNLDDEHLPHALAAALLLSARRGFVYGEDASDHLDLSHGQDDDAETIQLHKRTVAPFLAMDQVAQSLPEVLASRAEIQARRVRDDHEIFRLVRHPMLSTTPDPGFTDVLQRLALLFGIPDLFAVRRKVAIVTGDALTTKLAGPGIRAVELAKILATEHDVRLATTSGPPDLEVPGVEVVPGAAPHDVRALEAWCDVLVFQGFLLEQHPWLRDSRRALVADLYDPFHLEQLEVDRNLPLEDRVENLQSTVRLLNVQLARGDFFLCASPRQRDFWLGQLAAVGRINPSTYDPDQGLHRLIGVVPFGIPAAPPRKTKPVLRGVVPGIGQADVIVFWGGGLYPWFDPGVLVRAIAQVRSSLPSVRLVFLGGAHPNPDVPAMTTADETRELAADLGLLGEHVFFVDEWVPYAERQEYLLEADIAVSTHLDHLETEFSFRTRVLDYLWAELPMILTSGDALSDLVEREGLGRVVPPGDVDAIASALEALAKDESARAVCRQRIREVSPRFEWSAVAAPLLEFCRDPRRAADLVSKLGPVEFQPPFPPPPGRRARLAGAVGLVRRSARDDGVRTTAERVIRKLRGRLPGLARHSHAP